MPSVYRIYSDKGDKCYIGSTSKSLEHRFNKHKEQNPKYCCTSKTLFDLYGIENCYIEELEVLNDDIDKQYRLEREQHYLNIYQDTKVNKYSAIKTEEEKKQYRKEWEEKNKEERKKKRKQWNEINKDKVREQQRLYKENNKEKIKEYHKIYEEKNREKINQQKRERMSKKKEENKVKDIN